MNMKEKARRYDVGIESIKAMMESAKADYDDACKRYGEHSVVSQEYDTRLHSYKCALLALTEWQD